METRLNNGSSRVESAFSSASRIETEANLVIVPYLRRLAVRGEIIPTQNFMWLQKMFGDWVVRHSSGARTVEVKAEMKWTGNLFLEEWSNRSKFTPGWMYTCQADVLAYYFVEEKKLCLCPMPSLKAWAFIGDGGGLMFTHPARQQAKYDQQNDTWGRIVPVSALARGVSNFVGPFDPTAASEQHDKPAKQMLLGVFS